MNNKNESNLGAWIDMAEGLYDFLNRRKTTINTTLSNFPFLYLKAPDQDLKKRSGWSPA